MKHERDVLERQSGIPAHPERAANMVAVIVGALLGLGVGFFSSTGHIGMVIATIVGAIGGLVVAQLSHRRYQRTRVVDARLDREIGVIDGEIGSWPSPER